MSLASIAAIVLLVFGFLQGRMAYGHFQRKKATLYLATGVLSFAQKPISREEDSEFFSMIMAINVTAAITAIAGAFVLLFWLRG